MIRFEHNDLKLELTSYCLKTVNKCFLITGILSEPTRAEEINTVALIAGGLVAFIGLLCASSIIIFILRKKQKVCFKNTRRLRFPYCSNRSAPFNAHALTAPGFITSIKTNQSHCMREIDTNEHGLENIDKEPHRKTSRQFITDGQEKAIQYNYKVTLQKCNKYVEDVSKTEDNDLSDGLIV